MFGLKKIIKLFKQGNVMVTGLRGHGKDMLMSNVIARRREDYVSNMDYCIPNLSHIPLELRALDLSGNKYTDFVNGTVKQYRYPYPEKRDIYISDVGVYFPAQYCNELNKFYSEFPYFMALSRHLGDCNVHVNVQNINRAWDKIREQSDTYLYCRWCVYIPVVGIVIQCVTEYDKMQSCQDRVKPFRMVAPLMSSSDARTRVIAEREHFRQTYGIVKNHLLIYRNRSKYDTRYFKKLMGY